MQSLPLISFLIAAILSTNLYAQTSSSDVSKESKNCRIALPYQVEQHSNCTPQSAAAYDLAFCSVYLIMASRSAPDSDKILGDKSKAKAMEQKGVIYANTSSLLSDADTLKKNIGMTKKFFESLNGQESQYKSSIDYVHMKCKNIEGWHAQVLGELIAKMNVPLKETK